MIDLTNDYSSNDNKAKSADLLFFNSGRACNLMVLSSRQDGKWLVGEHSFLALKQTNQLKQLGVKLLFAKDEDLYRIDKVRQYIQTENICGIALEIPHAYLQGKVVGLDAYNELAAFYTKLQQDEISIYIDGARLLIAQVLYPAIRQFVSGADYIAYGCDKSLYSWSYGTFLQVKGHAKKASIAKRSKAWGTYNRKIYFSFTQLERQLDQDRNNIQLNFMNACIIQKQLRDMNITTNECMTNILSFYVADSQKNKKFKKALEKHDILINENFGSYTCYFNLTSNKQVLLQVIKMFNHLS